MSCPGVTIHCAGCAGGVAVPVVPLLELYGAMWLAEHIIEVAIACAVSGALAVAIVIALARWADRRDARRSATWQFQYVREVPATPAAPQVSRGIVPAIEHHYHGPQFIINGDSGQEAAARLIRQALAVPGREEIQP